MSDFIGFSLGFRGNRGLPAPCAPNRPRSRSPGPGEGASDSERVLLLTKSPGKCSKPAAALPPRQARLATILSGGAGWLSFEPPDEPNCSGRCRFLQPA